MIEWKYFGFLKSIRENYIVNWFIRDEKLFKMEEQKIIIIMAQNNKKLPSFFLKEKEEIFEELDEDKKGWIERSKFQ